MPMAMMDVVDVGMAMDDRLVAMPVGMGRLHELRGRVLVPMVLIVDVFVCVFQRFVLVQMFVSVRREQKRAHGHRRERDHTPRCKRLVQ